MMIFMHDKLQDVELLHPSLARPPNLPDENFTLLKIYSNLNKLP